MPMGFARMKSFHLFEHRKQRVPPRNGYRVLHDTHQKCLVRGYARRQPQGDAGKTLMIVGGSMPNGGSAEGLSKARECLQILLRIGPCPTARRITAESQSQCGKAPLCVGCRSGLDQRIGHDSTPRPSVNTNPASRILSDSRKMPPRTTAARQMRRSVNGMIL